MTAVDPAALRELLSASTVAPLAVKTTTDDGWAYLMDTPETYVGVGDADGDAMFRVEDAQLIAGAVNALPGLLAELGQARAERDAANAQAAKLAGELERAKADGAAVQRQFNAAAAGLGELQQRAGYPQVDVILKRTWLAIAAVEVPQGAAGVDRG